LFLAENSGINTSVFAKNKQLLELFRINLELLELN